MSSVKNFDIIIIGGGPGGYVAALRAAQLNMRVGLVEAAHLGGVCLNWGCIPTKALLRCAEVLTLTRHAHDFGVHIKNAAQPDLKAMVGRSRAIAGQLSAGIKHLLKKNKVTVFEGRGVLAGKGQVRVDDKETLAASHIILATGARARDLPHLKANGKTIWTAREAMTPEVLPKSLLVIGAGAIGIEFACFYNALGTKVTVVEMAPRILPMEDAEISALAHKAFTAKGLTLITNAKVQSYEEGKATLSTGEVISAERVLLAVGIVANTQNLGLENTAVKIDKGHIVTDSVCATAEKGIYAIGDLTAPPWLAHKASHEGVICVEAIAGLKPHALNPKRIPGCTYSTPQIASVGLSEEQALATHGTIKVGRFPFMGNGKALVLGESEGLVKTIFDAHTGELLGAHMIGAEVTEMIGGFALAMGLETTEAEVMETVFPHPTLSEAMHESVLSAYRKAIHF